MGLAVRLGLGRCRELPGLAAQAMLSYYRRFAPTAVKARMPRRARIIVERWLNEKSNGKWSGDAGSGPGAIAYSRWIARNDALGDHDRTLIQNRITALRLRPRFSIVLAVRNTPVVYLRQIIDSLRGQLYRDWELCVVDDASALPGVSALLREYAQIEPRVRLSFRAREGGFAASVNDGLEMVSGDWIIFPNDRDLFSEHALYLFAEAVNTHPGATIIYSDEDRIDDRGRRYRPYFKPDWDYDLFLGRNLIGPTAAYRASAARMAGGFREAIDGAERWDFALRVIEATSPATVLHVPFILYHARGTDDGRANSSPMPSLDAAMRVVNEHLTRTGQSAAASIGHEPNCICIKRTVPRERPPVSIIIPTRDRSDLLSNCVRSLVDRTDYKPVEIVIVNNASSEAAALVLLEEMRTWPNFKVIDDPRPFNFPRLCNLGVMASSGTICVLLNNDTEVINSGWLQELVSQAARPEVGAVGAKLYYPDDSLQHGGVILGLGGIAGHVHRFVRRDFAGYFDRLRLTHRLSCVTAACLAVRRTVYDEVGGFMETALPVAFNDVDFCLRVREAGYVIIWTPLAELYHHESLSRGTDNSPSRAPAAEAERRFMRARWGRVLDNDPYYNPNLSLDSLSFDLAARSRVARPWLAGTG